jgi:hypothetical protein
MDILSGLVFVLAGFAIVGWVVSPRTARSLDLFAAGFLPYRSAGWPRGVQEEDPVPWSWSSPAKPDGPKEAPESGLERTAEIVEISRADAPGTTAPGASTVVRGRASPPS